MKYCFGVLVTILFLSCDLSPFFPGNDSVRTAETPAAEEPENKFLSYAVLAADNPEIPRDYYGYITGTDIYITLPYQVLLKNPLVRPSVSLAPGYQVEPSGSYHVYDGMSLFLAGIPAVSTLRYTLHISIDQTTLSGVRLDRPFYVNDDGYRVGLTGYSFSYNYADAITVTFDTVAYGGNGPVILDEIFTKKIGFYDIDAPPDYTVDAPAARNGAVPPYTVEVTNASGLRNTFTLRVARTPWPDTSFESVYGTFKSAFAFSADTSSLYAASGVYPYHTNYEIFFSGGFEIRDAFGSGTNNYIMTTAAQIQANRQRLEAAAKPSFSPTDSFTSSSCALPVDIVAASPPDPVSVPVLLDYRLRAFTNGIGTTSDHSAWVSVVYRPQSFSFSAYQTVNIKYPPGVTVESVTPFMVVSGHTVAGNVVSFSLNLTDPAVRWTGDVARVALRAEDGTRNEEYVTIE